MSLTTEWIRYGENGEYSGYMSRMSGVTEPQPSVIVLQEIWGVDEHIRDVTDRFALAGYVAFAPDLFARNGVRHPGLEQAHIDEAKRFLNTVPPQNWRDPESRTQALSELPEPKRRTIDATLGQVFNLGGLFPGFVQQIAVTSSWLRDTYEYAYGQGVASVGFCLGGGLSAQLAVKDPQLKGAVIFYGAAPAAELIPEIQCPVAGFYGELDKRLTDALPEFAQAMEQAGKSLEYRVYPGAQHAFFNDTRPSYNIDASRDAFARTLQFLRRVLDGKAD